MTHTLLLSNKTTVRRPPLRYYYASRSQIGLIKICRTDDRKDCLTAACRITRKLSWTFPFFTECPRSNDRMERFACPTPDFRQRYRCIDDTSLCDGFFDCPGQEDENPDQCLFYKTVRFRLLCCIM